MLTKIYIATDSSPVYMAHYEICSELIDVLIDVTCIYGHDDKKPEAELEFDKKTSSFIRLSHQDPGQNIVLYLRSVDKQLALVCLINESEIHKKHLINYNIDRFMEGLKKIFEQTKASKDSHLQQKLQWTPILLKLYQQMLNLLCT